MTQSENVCSESAIFFGKVLFFICCMFIVGALLGGENVQEFSESRCLRGYFTNLVSAFPLLL